MDSTARSLHHVLRLLPLALVLVLIAGTPAEASTVITRGPSNRPWVALTFDDGWSVGNCARIAATLRAYGAVGTFFINGKYLVGSPARWKALLRGMPVASHTYSHGDLTRVPVSRVVSEIQRSRWAIRRILGRSMLPILRPPYGAYDSDVLAGAREAGIRKVVLWTLDTRDWVPGTSAGTIYRRAIGGGSGAIVLMHCGPSGTPGAVGAIIRWYQARGYRLVGLDRMLGL